MIATGAGIFGGLLAMIWRPGIQMRSAVQHFAAGAVIAAVAIDLLPEVERLGTDAGILIGFLCGGIAMIVLKFFVVRFERQEKEKGKLPVGLAVAAAVDTLFDGAIISAGFSSGESLGALLAIALALELLFLNLSVGTEFQKSKSNRVKGAIITTGIGLLLLVGAIGASFLLRDISKHSLAAFLSFGCAALIYLIAEELLVESIEAEESLFSTAMLFAGFLVVFAVKLLGNN